MSTQPTNKYEILTTQPFVKPDSDDRNYRYIRLPNRLEVLVIQDVTTEKAAAALDVNVGSVQDPASLPGLAHFCEHLLFMGTSKFPKESDYQEYLSDHAGRSNAYTAATSTNYYFEIGWNYLDGALDRFSQFFINPLFRNDSRDREINAIDSEHGKNIDNDVWRYHQLSKSLANPLNSHTRFSTGNIETLKTEPEKIGLDPRAELLKWYDNLYSSNIMRACILGRESLDQLCDMAAKYFADVKDKNVDVRRFEEEYKKNPYYTETHLTKHVKVKPVKNVKLLRVVFYVPLSEDLVFESKPGSYISHLVGHESKGSLLYDYSVTENWATSLAASFRQISDNNCLFEVDIDLTEEGYNHKQEILVKLFQYINMLKSLDEQSFLKVYEEIVDTTKLHFKFKEKSGQIMSTVSNNASTMQSKYLPDDKKHQFLNYFNFMNKKFDFDTISAVLDHLTPSNFILYEMNHSFDNLPNTDKWYGTKYEVSDLSKELVQALNDAGASSVYHLPPLPNPYIPKEIEIVNTVSKTPKTRPLLISKSSSMEIWFKSDDRFNSPKGSIVIFFFLPNSAKSLTSEIYIGLFKSLLIMKVNDLFYQAAMVDIRCDIYSNMKGFELVISGYSDKLLVLLESFISNLVDLLTTDTEFKNPEKFKLVRSSIIKKFKNFRYVTPYIQIGTYHRFLNYDHCHDPSSLLNLLVDEKGNPTDDYIDFDGFQNFLKIFLKQCHVRSLIIGNFKKEATVNSFKKLFDEKFFVQGLNPSPNSVDNFDLGIRAIMLGEGQVNRYETESENSNSSIFYYFQVDEIFPMYYDLKFPNSDRTCNGGIKPPASEGTMSPGVTYLAFEALKTFLKTPFFDQLRTKEQLGYVVLASSEINQTAYGYRVLVQSSVKSTYYLEHRIKHYIENGLKDLVHGMSDDDFNKIIESLKNQWQNSIKFKNLSSETFHYTGKIYAGTYQFEMTQIKLDSIHMLKKKDVIKVFDKYLLNDSTTKRLIIHLRGTHEKKYKEAALPASIPEGRLITNVAAFKSSSPLCRTGGPFMDLEYYKSYQEEEEKLDSKL